VSSSTSKRWPPGERHVEIEETYVDLDLHGTTVEISQLSRPIAGRQIEKTKRLLASIYRVDITSGDVALSWNKERLWFRTPDLMNREVAGTIQPARTPIDLTVKDPYTGARHRVTGWVGAMQRMSQTDAGLALLRRGRMIIGGPDANWRPREVVGSLNSHSGKRLIGELHMDDFPVNFTKDGFAWDAGLEEELINALAPAVQDLRSFADNARVAAKKIEPEDFVRAVDEVQRSRMRVETSGVALYPVVGPLVRLVDDNHGTGVEPFEPGDEPLGLPGGEFEELFGG
jgi:hypothetical protein